MAQISLYIDEQTLSRIETAARIEGRSLSEWVVERLRESLERSWPEGYEALYGAIDDQTFGIPEELSF